MVKRDKGDAAAARAEFQPYVGIGHAAAFQPFHAGATQMGRLTESRLPGPPALVDDAAVTQMGRHTESRLRSPPALVDDAAATQMDHRTESRLSSPPALVDDAVATQMDHRTESGLRTTPTGSLPALVDDAVSEILLRLPPSDPSSLARASLVCKAWRDIIASLAFLRRYRDFHQTLQLLGFLQHNNNNKQQHDVPVAHFTPTTAFRPSVLHHFNRRVLDCRHGRVLLQDINAAELVVWNPVTGAQSSHPMPPEVPSLDALLSYDCNAVVLCAAGAGCDHRGCADGPFFIAFAGVEDDIVVHASLYASQTGTWSPQTSIRMYSVLRLPAGLAGNATYFVGEFSTILQFDLGDRSLSVIQLPAVTEESPELEEVLLTGKLDGTLGVAAMFADRLHLWSREVDPGGVAGWAQHSVFKLGRPAILCGYADVANYILGCTDDGVFAISLDSFSSTKCATWAWTRSSSSTPRT
ncbi:hypothetical protein PR202_gb14078 [Eleusine coracana subsp. coracana]|uniref:F-box domain-containing protein n=1 Tax=Eleusine coracana subsp. coracana TaxID=191504 RepID=A0AAV5EUQ8_ELECO|nr:hypothetical protein QOZ80_4BG0331650 [Eleusine coracana subsp. coracana]GJN26168.1 hypothetical protein PR202_gb14078 [Eleusine coracana subsp. coracana]